MDYYKEIIKSMERRVKESEERIKHQQLVIDCLVKVAQNNSAHIHLISKLID